MANPKYGNQNYEYQPFPKMVYRGDEQLIVDGDEALEAALEDGFEDRTSERTAAKAPKKEATPKLAPKPALKKDGPISL